MGCEPRPQRRTMAARRSTPINNQCCAGREAVDAADSIFAERSWAATAVMDIARLAVSRADPVTFSQRYRFVLAPSRCSSVEVTTLCVYGAESPRGVSVPGSLRAGR